MKHKYYTKYIYRIHSHTHSTILFFNTIIVSGLITTVMLIKCTQINDTVEAQFDIKKLIEVIIVIFTGEALRTNLLRLIMPPKSRQIRYSLVVLFFKFYQSSAEVRLLVIQIYSKCFTATSRVTFLASFT